MCTKNEKGLKEVTVKDLIVGEVGKDTIMWVKTIVDPLLINSLTIIVEDKNKEAMSLGLYNQISKDASHEELFKMFPNGTEFGIKQPYLKLSYSGVLALRNDNPGNIVFGDGKNAGELMALELKEKGNSFFKKGDYQSALKYFKEALKQQCEKKLQIILLSNSA